VTDDVYCWKIVVDASSLSFSISGEAWIAEQHLQQVRKDKGIKQKTNWLVASERIKQKNNWLVASEKKKDTKLVINQRL
jgi:hypothetical protein